MAKAKQTELVKTLSGKATEPKFTGLVYTKMDLIKALNYYSAFSKPDDLKAWSITYLVKHHPELVNRVQSLPACCFLTYGALCRMESRGFDHDDSMRKRIKEFFQVVEAPKSEEKPLKKHKSPEKTSETMDAFDGAIDSVMKGNKPEFNPKESNRDVIAICKRELNSLEEHPEDYKASLINPLKKFYKNALEKIEALKAKPSKPAKTIIRKKRVNPANIVKAVKYQKSESKLNITSLNPIDALDKKKMYVYDTSKRRLYVYHAINPGFTFTGTTLKNVDMNKSAFKTIRKPEVLFSGKIGLQELNAAFSTIKTKAQPLTATRFSDSFIILKVS